MSNFIINDINIELIKKNIKNIHLSVHPPYGKVRLAVPMRMDEEAINSFIVSKLPWINKHRKRYAILEQQNEIKFKSGESHYFLGDIYILNIVETKGKQHVELRNDKYLDLYVGHYSSFEKREKVMSEWYRQNLKAILPDYIDKWEKIIGVSVNEWNVKLMKTRWGTCNVRDKRIWINLELAKKNPRCIEYIVVHEMVHLLERYHNDNFKMYMNMFLPNWKIIRDELNGLTFESNKWAY